MEHIVYIFEGFRLDAGRRQLSTSGGVVAPLNSRAMEALVMLVSRAGDLVTKRQLLEGVWPSAVVEDNNINQCVLAIRKALGENAGSNRFIMTVPGRGYRFVAPVAAQTRAAAEDIQESAPRGSPALARRWRNIATAGTLIAVMLVFAAMYMRDSRPVSQGASFSPDLVVQLRRDDAGVDVNAAALLQDCLRQRPDLHLQIEVHVVGAQSSQPMWSGQYIAGADDVLRGGTRRQVRGNACGSLAATP